MTERIIRAILAPILSLLVGMVALIITLAILCLTVVKLFGGIDLESHGYAVAIGLKDRPLTIKELRISKPREGDTFQSNSSIKLIDQENRTYTLPPTNDNYRALAREAAIKHGLDPALFEAQIEAESNFCIRGGKRVDCDTVISRSGAIGIAQIMPTTAKGWGVNPRDEKAALNAAAKNMRNYLDSKKCTSLGDIPTAKRCNPYTGKCLISNRERCALSAYNAGPGRAVDKWGIALLNGRRLKEPERYARKIEKKYTRILRG